MGCVSTNQKPSLNNIPLHKTKSNTQSTHNYGVKISNKDKLQISHAPLYKNEKLHKKFNSGNTSPEEVLIPCMIVTVKIGRQNQDIQVKVIHQNSAELWVICGGKEKVSITGLTLAIEDITWCGKIDLQGSSSIDGDWHLAKPKQGISTTGTVTIILSQISSTNSIFIIHEYTPSGQKIRQKLQWNSLSFNLGQVYRNTLNNAQQNQKEYCVSCLTNVSDCIFLPCRHMCLCYQCSESHKKTSKKCPLCRKDFTSIIQYKQHNSNQ